MSDFVAGLMVATRPTPACDDLRPRPRHFALVLLASSTAADIAARSHDPMADSEDLERFCITPDEWYAAHHAALADLAVRARPIDPYVAARLEVQRLEVERKAPISDRERAAILRRHKDAAAKIDPSQPFGGNIEWHVKVIPMAGDRLARAGDTPTHFLPACDARIFAAGRYEDEGAARNQARALSLTLEARTRRGMIGGRFVAEPVLATTVGRWPTCDRTHRAGGGEGVGCSCVRGGEPKQSCSGAEE